MKRFNKMTEKQMCNTIGASIVTFPTIIGGILTVGATSALGGVIGSAAGRAKNKKQ